jgi:hypothetical protein
VVGGAQQASRERIGSLTEVGDYGIGERIRETLSEEIKPLLYPTPPQFRICSRTNGERRKIPVLTKTRFSKNRERRREEEAEESRRRKRRNWR